jgi:HK97 gp10 family phage protein
MELKYSFAGDKELEKKLKGISRRAKGQALRTAAKAGAEMIVEEAKRLAPVDTGTMRDSIRSVFGKRTSDSVTVEIGHGKKGWYGRFVEEGTSKMAARPHLRPAMDEMGWVAADVCRGVMMREVLEEAKRK